ncbi:hypothetical protein GCM10009827_083750 [Dactylosporangium maewongense]|uniref:Uncharacterized protein n=1 Tax=Dactylosporangium maewongense TaxID=634393 RepID=A0ABP4MY93_9ACTN
MTPESSEPSPRRTRPRTNNSRQEPSPVPSLDTTARAAKGNDPTRRLPAVTGPVYPPAAARGRYLAIVTNCPFCEGRHAHYLGTAVDTSRMAGCRRGRYLLNVSRSRRHAAGSSTQKGSPS